MKRALLLFLLLGQIFCSNAQTYTIGNGTLTGGYDPIEPVNNYGWNFTLYSLTAPCLINSIQYNMASSNSATSSNVRIYMRNYFSNLNSFVPDTITMTLVYAGPVTWNGPGWITPIVLQTPFYHYNGNSLLVCIFNNDGSPLSPAPLFYHTYTSNNIRLCKFGSTVPSLGSGFNFEYYYANIRLNTTSPPELSLTLYDPTGTNNIGMDSIRVTVTNNSSVVTVNSFKVNWKVDNSPVTTYNWSGTLFNNSTTPFIIAGNYNFTSGNHNVKVWVSDPNNTQDPFPANDTAKRLVTTCSGPLSGTYTLGHGPPANFFSFGNAIQALQDCGGVNGPVVFKVDTGHYYERVHITPIAGTSSVNTVTFKSASGLNTDVIVSYVTNSLNPPFSTIHLDSTAHVIIRDMTIKPASYYTSIGIDISNRSHDIEIRNNILLGPPAQQALIITRQDNPYTYHNTCEKNILIDSNSFFSTGGKAIRLQGPVGGRDTNITISNNYSNFGGFYAEDVSGLHISKNRFDRFGIDLRKCDNINVEKNNYNSTYLPDVVMYFEHCNGTTSIPLKINNNFVRSSGQGSTGVYFAYCSRYLFYHNTVYLYDTTTVNSNLGIESINCDTFEIKNNISVCPLKGAIGFVQCTNFITDYNDLWGSFYRVNGTGNFAWYQGILQQEYNSYAVKPSFVSYTDIHLLNDTNLINKGIYVGINDDIDGDSRLTSVPDIGADECGFTNTSTNDLSNIPSAYSEIFPNPFHSTATLKIHLTKPAKTIQVKVYDIFQNEISTTQLNNLEMQIDRNGLRSGMYFYSVLVDGAQVCNGKFIVE